VTIAYILGNGSVNNNLELRFSLRSVEMFAKPDRVVVCGEDPGFLSDRVDFIPNRPEGKPDDPAYGIMSNLKKLAESLDGEFVLMNDDLFLLRPLENVPYLHKGSLTDALEAVGSGAYYCHLLETRAQLRRKSLPQYHFDGHWPIVYDAKKLLDVIASFRWDVSACPCMRSLYCNSLGIEGMFSEDIKANWPQRDWKAFCEGKGSFSVQDQSFDWKCKEYCLHLWNHKSIYEK